jgi:outer membrane protein assembly factor BamB
MRCPLIVRRTLVVLAVATCCASAFALDWPQWRGPERNGLSDETGLLKDWPKDGPKQLWRVSNIGTGYSTPVVVGDRIYLLGNNGVDNEFVQALNAADGQQLWSQKIGKVGNPDQKPTFPGARSTPTLDGDRLFVLGSDGDLACLEAASGKPVWQKNVRTDFGGKPGAWAYAESPLVDGDVVVCTPGGADATLVALNKATGDVVWKAPLAEGDKAGYASVVIAEIGGVKQYVQFLEHGLAGVDAATGKTLWRYGRTGEGSPANIPTPLVSGDYIYSAAGRTGGGLVRIKAEGGKFEPEEVYFEGNLPKSIGGTVRVGDCLYGTSDALMCVEFLTGASKWKEKSVGAASVCYADGCLYLHGENGEVALVEATPEKYVEKGRFTPAEAPDHGASKAWAYPVVSGGRLYIFDYGTLWCYDVKASGN